MKLKTVAGRPYRYQGLLIAIVAMYLISSVLHHFPRLALIFNILFTIIMATAVYAVSEKRRSFLIALGLALFSLGITWYNSLAATPVSPVLDQGTNVVFFGYVSILIAIHLYHAEEITADTVFGAICLYLFFAFIWGFLYSLIYYLNPHSFDLGPHGHDVLTFLYFSIVTLTTLGYGDIIPLSPPAMALTSLQAVVGPVYLAVLIAHIVGILSAQRSHKNK